MLIAQLTDIHIGFEPDARPEELNRIRFRATLARVLDGPNRPDMLVATGDMTDHGDHDSFLKTAELLAACPFPVLPMVGNHDSREGLLAAFPDTPTNDGFVQYEVEKDGLRILLLDTLEPGRHGGEFCEARAAWLKAQLVAHPETPTIIVMHHPPFESGITWLDSAADEPWIGRFREAVSGHRQVRAIISGHLHRTIHTLWGGISLTVCPSSAPLVALDLTPIDPDRPDGRAMITDELPAYALHRLDGERLISHFESVGDWAVLASYNEQMQPVVRLIDVERGGK